MDGACKEEVVDTTNGSADRAGGDGLILRFVYFRT